MPSSRPGQRGASLIEVVIAAALLGIGVVTGLTAWDTAAMGASRAVRLAWAQCVVRAELDAIMASTFEDSYSVPDAFAANRTLQVLVDPVRGAAGAADEEQQVTVQAFDPQSRQRLAQAVALRTRALQGAQTVDGKVDEVRLGCPQQ
jgi:Tfp pilus assembly protein PilV